MEADEAFCCLVLLRGLNGHLCRLDRHGLHRDADLALQRVAGHARGDRRADSGLLRRDYAGLCVHADVCGAAAGEGEVRVIQSRGLICAEDVYLCAVSELQADLRALLIHKARLAELCGEALGFILEYYSELHVRALAAAIPGRGGHGDGAGLHEGDCPLSVDRGDGRAAALPCKLLRSILRLRRSADADGGAHRHVDLHGRAVEDIITELLASQLDRLHERLPHRVQRQALLRGHALAGGVLHLSCVGVCCPAHEGIAGTGGLRGAELHGIAREQLLRRGGAGAAVCVIAHDVDDVLDHARLFLGAARVLALAHLRTVGCQRRRLRLYPLAEVVPQRWDDSLRDEHRAAYRAVRALGQTVLGTGRGKRSISHRSMDARKFRIADRKAAVLPVISAYARVHIPGIRDAQGHAPRVIGRERPIGYGQLIRTAVPELNAAQHRAVLKCMAADACHAGRYDHAAHAVVAGKGIAADRRDAAFDDDLLQRHAIAAPRGFALSGVVGHRSAAGHGEHAACGIHAPCHVLPAASALGQFIAYSDKIIIVAVVMVILAVLDADVVHAVGALGESEGNILKAEGRDLRKLSGIQQLSAGSARMQLHLDSALRLIAAVYDAGVDDSITIHRRAPAHIADGKVVPAESDLAAVVPGIGFGDAGRGDTHSKLPALNDLLDAVGHGQLCRLTGEDLLVKGRGLKDGAVLIEDLDGLAADRKLTGVADGDVNGKILIQDIGGIVKAQTVHAQVAAHGGVIPDKARLAVGITGAIVSDDCLTEHQDAYLAVRRDVSGETGDARPGAVKRYGTAPAAGARIIVHSVQRGYEFFLCHVYDGLYTVFIQHLQPVTCNVCILGHNVIAVFHEAAAAVPVQITAGEVHAAVYPLVIGHCRTVEIDLHVLARIQVAVTVHAVGNGEAAAGAVRRHADNGAEAGIKCGGFAPCAAGKAAAHDAVVTALAEPVVRAVSHPDGIHGAAAAAEHRGHIQHAAGSDVTGSEAQALPVEHSAGDTHHAGDFLDGHVVGNTGVCVLPDEVGRVIDHGEARGSVSRAVRVHDLRSRPGTVIVRIVQVQSIRTGVGVVIPDPHGKARAVGEAHSLGSRAGISVRNEGDVIVQHARRVALHAVGALTHEARTVFEITQVVPCILRDVVESEAASAGICRDIFSIGSIYRRQSSRIIHRVLSCACCRITVKLFFKKFFFPFMRGKQDF